MKKNNIDEKLESINKKIERIKRRNKLIEVLFDEIYHKERGIKVL